MIYPHLMLITLIENLSKQPNRLIAVLEAGLSDFHLIALTIMRKSFKKLQHKIIIYRSYKNLSNEKFI